MKLGRRAVIATVAGIVTLQGALTLGFFALNGRLPTVTPAQIDLSSHPPLLEWEAHNAIYARGEFPYVLDLTTDAGALLYVGVQHSSDPNDPQFDVVRALWSDFEPTVALNEGRAKYTRWLSERFGGVNDPMVAYRLARADGVPIYSLEPSYETEVAALLNTWPADVVACYFSLRVIVAESGGDPQRAERIAPGLMAKRTNVDGLRGTLQIVDDLDAVWRRFVPNGPDWRTLTNLDSVAEMRAVGNDSRQVRGEHMVRALADLMQRGERVIAVVGASHVIRQERMLRSVLAPATP